MGLGALRGRPDARQGPSGRDHRPSRRRPVGRGPDVQGATAGSTSAPGTGTRATGAAMPRSTASSTSTRTRCAARERSSTGASSTRWSTPSSAATSSSAESSQSGTDEWSMTERQVSPAVRPERGARYPALRPMTGGRDAGESGCSGAATSGRRSWASSPSGRRRSRPAPASISRSSASRSATCRAAVTSRSIPALLTNDAASVVTDPDVDLVVEVIGGIEPARELITAALAAGKPVVTANKELLANVGVELFEAAERAGRRPALRGGRRRRHPDRAGAAREPARRADLAGDGHRQRHDELHPHEDDRAADRLRGRPRRGPAARLRRA